jgi:hypothetical protein
LRVRLGDQDGARMLRGSRSDLDRRSDEGELEAVAVGRAPQTTSS